MTGLRTSRHEMPLSPHPVPSRPPPPVEEADDGDDELDGDVDGPEDDTDEAGSL